jgi:hypothetical protein
MKKIIILLCLFLVSCNSNVRKYTSEEVAEYNLKTTNTSKASMKSVKQMSRDTIWTFQESYDRGLKWQTIDHHTFSSSFNEENSLFNNYKIVVIDYYLNKQSEIEQYFDIRYSYIDGYRVGMVFNKKYSSRSDLKEACEKLQSFKEYVTEENQQYADKELDYGFQIKFMKGNHTFFLTDSLAYEDADQENLTYALIYQDAESLLEYSNEEQNECVNDLSLIFMKDEDSDTWLKTSYYTEKGKDRIASTVLFDILQDLDLGDVKIEGTRDNYKVWINDEEYGRYEDVMIPFMVAEKITGIQFNIDE